MMKRNKSLALPGLLLISFMLTSVIAGCDNQGWQLSSFQKYDGNPILTPRGTTWQSKDVFNPTAWSTGETVYLLYRAEDSTGIGQWNGTSRIGLATSSDGITFERQAEPLLEPTESWELPGGMEDPRLVHIEDTFYLTYTAYDGEIARLALASSPDMKSWTKHGLVFPDSSWTKAGAILPRKVNDKWWMYFGDTNIWAAHSEDLIHWTPIEEPVMRPREDKFDSRLVEPGPHPLMTNRGILLLYNSADEDLVYRAGQALFDADDPTRLIARSETPFLEPDLELEKEGQIPNVVFIEGLVNHQNTWYLYYGMGDSGIGVAFSTGW